MRLAAADDRAALRAYQVTVLGPNAEPARRFAAALADVDANPLPPGRW